MAGEAPMTDERGEGADRQAAPLESERLATAIHLARNHAADPRARELPHLHRIADATWQEAREIIAEYNRLTEYARRALGEQP